MEKNDILKKYLLKRYDYQNVSYFDSGTQSISQILKQLKFEKNDEIIIPVSLCISVVQEIINNNLIPVFVDIDDNFLINKQEIAKRINDKTMAIIYVNQYGFNCKASNYFNKKGKIINILDCCQSTFVKIDSNIDYAFFSFSANKPYSIGKYSIVVSNKIISNQKILEKVEKKIIFKSKIYFFKKIKSEIIEMMIEKKLHNYGFLIKTPRNSYHRIVFVINIKKEEFKKFEKNLYAFMSRNNLNIVQTTIDISPFQDKKIKKYINSKLKNKNSKIYNFNKFNELSNKTLYFRNNNSFKEYRMIINYIYCELRYLHETNK